VLLPDSACVPAGCAVFFSQAHVSHCQVARGGVSCGTRLYAKGKEPIMKGVEQKRDSKKKPQKSLKEKRAEKHAKKSDRDAS